MYQDEAAFPEFLIGYEYDEEQLVLVHHEQSLWPAVVLLNPLEVLALYCFLCMLTFNPQVQSHQRAKVAKKKVGILGKHRHYGHLGMLVMILATNECTYVRNSDGRRGSGHIVKFMEMA